MYDEPPPTGPVGIIIVVVMAVLLAFLIIQVIRPDYMKHGTGHDAMQYCLEQGFSDYQYSNRRAYCTHGVKPSEIVPKEVYWLEPR